MERYQRLVRHMTGGSAGVKVALTPEASKNADTFSATSEAQECQKTFEILNEFIEAHGAFSDFQRPF